MSKIEIITSDEISSRDIHDDYKILWHKKLGKGATKDPVYLATHIKSRQKVAVKMVRDTPQARREIHLQRRCQHSTHVLSILDVYSNTSSRISPHRKEEHYLYIVLELMEGGTLLSLLEDLHLTTAGGQGGMSEPLAAAYFRQILLALSTLHQQGIMHRDLKLENILLTDKYSIYDLEDEEECADFHLQLADFGFSVEETDRPTQAMYTPFYAAPEVLANQQQQQQQQLQSGVKSYDTRIDLWSLGVCLYIMLSSTPPFYTEEYTRTGLTPDMRESIRKGEFSFYHECWEEVSQEAKDLITALLQADPDKRLSLDRVSQHPWLNQDS